MVDQSPQPLYGVKCLPVEDVLCQISVWIHRTIPTLLLIIGTIGNTVNIFVLSRKNIRATPCFLLVFLAFFDMLFLFSMYIETPFGDDYEEGSLSFLACSILTWLAASSGTASLWTVAIFTIERILFVMIPHRNNIHLTRNKSVLITGIIVLIIFTTFGALIIGDAPSDPSIHMDITNGTMNDCDNFACWRTSVKDEAGQEILQTTVLLSLNIIPFFVVVIGNIVLVAQLCRRRRVGSPIDSQTLMLLLITGLMLSTIAPYGCYVVALQVLSSTLDKSYPLSELLFSIVYSLFMANHALNFALYAWKGTLFKKECGLIWKEIESVTCMYR